MLDYGANNPPPSPVIYNSDKDKKHLSSAVQLCRDNVLGIPSEVAGDDEIANYFWIGSMDVMYIARV